MTETLSADLARAFFDGLRPDPIESVAEWAGKHRYLTSESTGEIGLWRNERTPYLVEIMECLSPQSRVEEVVFMKSSQIGGTECGNNWIAYIIARGLGPTLVVQKAIGLAERYSKQRLEPMIRSSPALVDRVRDRRVRDSGNTILQKSFPGGAIMLAGAESAAGLRSMPIRNLFLDEIDAYDIDVDGEGDPVKLAERRTMNFPRRKILKVSTPTHESTSKIAAAFAQTDQRYFHVPCPECGHFQRLTLANLRREKDGEGRLIPKSVRYECESCKAELREHHKRRMLLGGKWVPAAEELTGLRRGYHISALYSPWFPWWRVADEWIQAQASQELLKGFINTLLGETWKERTEKPEWRRLYARRERWKEGTVPMGGHLLTAGVDVQRDRLEIEIVAWGPGHESWSVQYDALEGDPAEPAVWDKLDAYLSRTWPHESGLEMRLARVAVDTGDQTQIVYAWARRHLDQVIPIKGRDKQTEIVARPRAVDLRASGKIVKKGARVWNVGVSTAKHELYSWLRLPEPTESEPAPRGYCHFPDGREEEWFQQLCSEEWTSDTNKKSRRLVYYWRQTRPRNEALDCRVYARAAAASLGVDRWEDETWGACLGTWGVDSEGVGRSGQETEGPSSTIRPPGYLKRHQKP